MNSQTELSVNRLKKSPRIWVGYLFLILLLVNCRSILTFGSSNSSPSGNPNAGAVESPAPTTPVEDSQKADTGSQAPTASDQLTLAPSGDEAAAAPAQNSSLGNSLDAPPADVEPQIGKITFALDVANNTEPLNTGNFFTHGITQVHAIFNYSNMQPEYTWERVWYLNDKEVARVTETWDAPEAGVFNYFIDNSGRPLPAGNWILELYVEGELHSLGVFVIEPPDAASEAGTGSGVYQLAYTKCDGNHHNIYVADTNGNNQQLIVTRGAGPSWTPSGGALFFYGEEGVDRQTRNGIEYVFDGISNGLVALNAAPLPTSINQLNLFQNVEWKQATARWARVSPDGTMVAFDAKPGGDYRIYFLGAGENQQQYRIEIPGEQADWSPNSQQIVYRSGRDGKTGIWISNQDDTNPVQITGHGSDSFPAWSPDGSTIAFSRDEGGNVDIYAVNVDGSNLRRLTTAPGHDTLPTFAPNGDIIFRSARTGSWGIWKMGGDGSNQTQIIANACVGQDWAYSRMDVLP